MARRIDSPGPAHVAFEEWAKGCGIMVNGVGAARFHGQGLGMAALRKIDAGETIVLVPTSAMLTLQSIPSTFKAKFGEGISNHGLIAAFLYCGGDEALSKYAAWWAVWPTLQDFKESMPILWPEELKDRIPRETSSTRSITEYTSPSKTPRNTRSFLGKRSTAYDDPEYQGPLAQQENKFEKCFQALKGVFPDADRTEYCYYWLIVNTRSFYYLPLGADSPKERNDAMALCPFADYFNHTDDGFCNVSFDNEGYSVKTTKAYEPGEEIYVCYGQHNSDLLLVEYGFVPASNAYDAINLDYVVLNDIDPELQEDLVRERYFGNYQLTAAQSEPCYRTEVAACIKYMSLTNWVSFIRGLGSAPYDGLKSDETIKGWIREYKNGAELAIGQLVVDYGVGLGGDDDDDERVMTVLRRWKQIVELCEKGLRYLRT